MTRTKICGVTRETDLDAAVEAGADAVGVTAGVTVETPREVSLDRASELLAAVPPFVTSVLVTMPDSVERAVELVETTGPDAVQLHGALDPEAIRTVRERAPAAVLAAVDVQAPDVTAYADAADAVLVDSTDESGAGGTGETHDWERTRALVEATDTPVVLAGGLTPDNVMHAVRTARPFAVDVASGVESAGGVKDHDAVASFVDRVARTRVEP
ncbi:MAG: phosphoribosylanthranilate isomerase [Haloglomus sp.]